MNTPFSNGFIDSFFFFNDTAATEIYTLSLHDALPILQRVLADATLGALVAVEFEQEDPWTEQRPGEGRRSEEHTSELQSQSNLVCRLLLEKKKINALKSLHAECQAKIFIIPMIVEISV